MRFFFFFMAENIFLRFIGIDMMKNRMKNRNWVKRAALFGVVLYCALSASAQSVCDSVAIHFHVNEAELDWNFMTNRSSLEEIKEKFKREYNDTASWKLRKVEVVGSFSPEGTITKNRALAERRAETLFKFISTLCEFPDSLKSLRVVDGDWGSLVRMAEADGNLPMRQQTLKALREVVRYAPQANWLYERSIYRLKRLGGGEPYRYICDHYFPLQRHSVMYLCFIKEIRPVVVEPDTVRVEEVEPDIVVAEKEGADTLRAEEAELEELDEFTERKFPMAVKSNLLFDVVTALNYSIEVPFKEKYSVLFQHHFPWWERDNKYCLQFLTFGGEFRWWFAPSSQLPAKYRRENNLLLGHFVGANVWGGKGDIQIGRKFGCYHFDFWSVGLSYGYSMPIGRRFNLEFTVSVGYAHIPYQHYIPSDNWEVLIKDNNKFGTLNYVGITKAEVNLVMPLNIKIKR